MPGLVPGIHDWPWWNKKVMVATSTLTPREFWFLRHGETDWNAQNLSQGSIDVPLNANGLAQAHAAAKRLVGRGIAALVGSPLQRARVTGEIVADAIGLPLILDASLREVSFASKEGQPMAPWFSEWVAGNYTPEGAESFAELRARAVAVLNRLLSHPAPLLVVGHGAFFRALRAAMGLEPNYRLPNATPMICTPGHPAWVLTAV